MRIKGADVSRRFILLLKDNGDEHDIAKLPQIDIRTDISNSIFMQIGGTLPVNSTPKPGE